MEFRVSTSVMARRLIHDWRMSMDAAPALEPAAALAAVVNALDNP
jgi:hypothetical protein